MFHHNPPLDLTLMMALFSNIVAFEEKKADCPFFYRWHWFLFLRKELPIPMYYQCTK
jgi:hypothetical protein